MKTTFSTQHGAAEAAKALTDSWIANRKADDNPREHIYAYAAAPAGFQIFTLAEGAKVCRAAIARRVAAVATPEAP